MTSAASPEELDGEADMATIQNSNSSFRSVGASIMADQGGGRGSVAVLEPVPMGKQKLLLKRFVQKASALLWEVK